MWFRSSKSYLCKQQTHLPFHFASQQRTTPVSFPSACMCVRQSTLCAGTQICWRGPCLPTSPASASPPAPPYPTPGYAPTPSLTDKSKRISIHVPTATEGRGNFRYCRLFFFFLNSHTYNSHNFSFLLQVGSESLLL